MAKQQPIRREAKKVTTVSIPQKVRSALEEIVEAGYYSSVSEILNDGARRIIIEIAPLLDSEAKHVKSITNPWGDVRPGVVKPEPNVEQN